jgi:hypothetical protein
MTSYLGMGPLVVALLPAAGRVATLVWLTERPVALVGLAEIVLSALEQYPLFNLSTSHLLRSCDFVRAPVARKIEVCVATLRECIDRSVDSADGVDPQKWTSAGPTGR